MKIKSLASIACALIVMVSFNANAVVNILGDTQYAWLKLTAPETLGKSRVEVQAALDQAAIDGAGNNILYGYEYASRAQVEALLLSYVPWDGLDGLHVVSAEVSGAAALIADFGPTDTVPGSGTNKFVAVIDIVDGATDPVPYDDYDKLSGLYGTLDECGTDISCISYIELYRDAAPALNNTLAYLNSFFGFDDTADLDAAQTAGKTVLVGNSVVSTTRGSFLVKVLNISIYALPDANASNAASYEVSGTCTDGDGNVIVAITGAGTPPANQIVSCTPGTGAWDATFDVSSITDGVNALTINASQTDAFDNTGNADPVQVDKDATEPVVVISGAPVANAGNAASYPVSGTCTDGDSGVTVAITGAGTPPANQTVPCATGTGTWAATFDVSLINDGMNALTINASQMDAFANTGNAGQVQVDKDVAEPGVVISAPATTDNTPFDITITFDEAVTGFVSGEITVVNATVGSFAGSGAVYTATITPGGAGNITIDVAAGVAEDAANNTNTAATQAVVTPAVSATNTTISVSATSIAVGSATVTITVQAKDANGNNFNVSGGVVTLASTGSASISAVIDNTDGTYTATISNTVVETVTISGTISGNAITGTAEVRFFAPDGGDGGSINPVYLLLLLLLLVTLRHKHRAVF